MDYSAIENSNPEQKRFEHKVFEVCLKQRGPSSHPIKSGIRSLNRAYMLMESMPEVSSFLAITAVEECTSALFEALQQKRYSRAGELSSSMKRQHRYKQGAIFFIRSAGHSLSDLVNELGELKIRFTLDGTSLDEPGEKITPFIYLNGKYAFPGNSLVSTPPLSYVSIGKDYTDKLREEIDRDYDGNFVDDFKKVVNQRNKLLYATSSGIPASPNCPSFVQSKKDDCILILGVTLCILQNDSDQPLARDLLGEFLDCMKANELL